jgi:putative transposase
MLYRDGTYRKRRRVFNEVNHAHELTFSCYHGIALLSKDRTRTWLIESLDRARREWKFALWAYVIMPNHAHVLFFPLDAEYRMDLICKAIKQSVARRAISWLREHSPGFLKQLAGTGSGTRRKYHFWQPGGGYDRNIDNSTTAWNAVQYLHLNPVRKHLVERPEDWRWSSAQWYAGQRDVPLKMDGTPPEAGR